MFVSAAVAAATHIVVPLALGWGLWRGEHESKAAWLLAALGSGAYVLFFYLAGGGWHVLSYYLRVAVTAAFLVALVASFLRVRRTGAPRWRRPGSAGGWTSLAIYALLALLFGASTLSVLPGHGHGDERAARLAFPLEGGPWYVVHGGASPALNYHNVDRAQRYALDVVRLNAAGTRARGLQPEDPQRYAAFDALVHSPCAGEVLRARDGMPDHEGAGTDRQNPAGNHVVVRCADAEPAVDVVLAHLREGSVSVEEGARVEAGRPIGRVGNSGNTSEPHLHVHAIRTGTGSVLEGEGVPVLFDGRFLARGDLIL